MISWSDKQIKNVAYAGQLAKESQPIKGMLAEQYLTEYRGITLDEIPTNIRFRPAVYSKKNAAIHPALLAIARNDKSKDQAIQAIFLDEKTGNKADVEVKNQTWGVLPGASVDLMQVGQKSKNRQVTYMAEGVETALSILQSVTNAHVKVTLGTSNFAHPSKKNLAPYM